jgi:hypothetical protein
MLTISPAVAGEIKINTGDSEGTIQNPPISFLLSDGPTENDQTSYEGDVLSSGSLRNPDSIDLSLASLPLSFLHYQERAGAGDLILCRGMKSTLFFTPTQVMYAFLPSPGPSDSPIIVTQEFIGADPDTSIECIDPLSATVNDFTGDLSSWRTNIPAYGGLMYCSIYPGIDLAYRGTEGSLKREFIVHPGADPDVVRMVYHGVNAITVKTEARSSSPPKVERSRKPP